MSKRVGIFGGTFNPLHSGHINSLLTVMKKLEFDEIKVVPAYVSPFRSYTDGPSPEQRLRMVQVGFKEYSNKVVVEDFEVRKGGTSYTIDTIQHFTESNPDSEYFLIVGLDQFEVFDQWKDFNKILNKVNLVVTSRPGIQFPEDVDQLPQGVAVLVKDFNESEIDLVTGQKIKFVQLDDIDVSATELRKALRMGQSVEEKIPSKVQDFINEEGLYQKLSGKIGDFEDFTVYCANLIFEKKGLGVNAYDLRHLVMPSEFALVASGTSTRHATALAEYLIRQVKTKYGVYPLSIEGQKEGRWVVLDYGALILHIFYDYTRQEYQLEELWKDGVNMNVKDPSEAKH